MPGTKLRPEEFEMYRLCQHEGHNLVAFHRLSHASLKPASCNLVYERAILSAWLQSPHC